MNFMTNKNRFFIVNDFDRPSEELIAERRGEFFYYVHPEHTKYGKMKSPMATPVEDFGVEIEVSEDGHLSGKLLHRSVATYPDGHPRRWQGRDTFNFQMNGVNK